MASRKETTTKDEPEVVRRSRQRFGYAHGYVVYRVKGSSGLLYDVTLRRDGRASSCVEAATGESCKGWHFTGRCKHAALAQEREAARQGGDKPRPTLAETEQKMLAAPLNGDRSFDLLRR